MNVKPAVNELLAPGPAFVGQAILLPKFTRSRNATKTPLVAACSTNEGKSLLAFGIAAAVSVTLTFSHPARAIISAPECFGGVGPGCDASALEAPVIKELLEKSRANNDKHEQERRTKYWTDGYKSYFSFGYDKVLKRHDDGTYSLERPESLIAKTLRSLGVQLPSASGSE